MGQFVSDSGFPAEGPAVGFDWLCFVGPEIGLLSHNPFQIRCLRLFGLCQIGFVFSNCPRAVFSIWYLAFRITRQRRADWLPSTALRIKIVLSNCTHGRESTLPLAFCLLPFALFTFALPLPDSALVHS